MAKMLPTIKSNIPFVMDTLGRADLAKKDIYSKYMTLAGVTHESEFGGQPDKYGRFLFTSTFTTCLQKLKQAGALSSPKRGVYTLEDESLILGSFIPHGQSVAPTQPVAPTQSVAPTPEVETTPSPVVDPTPSLEVETPVVEETEAPVVEVQSEVDEPIQEPMVEVSVKNPAVIEAHIDTETNELVENVGGSKDWRKPLDQVEDGYITSNVEITTTTLNPVEEDEVEEDEVEEATSDPVVEVIEDPTPEVEVVEAAQEKIEDEPQETFEAQEVVETPVEVEDALEDDLEVLFDGLDEQEGVSYDLQALRNDFDPHVLPLTLKDGTNIKGDYLVYRDKENRNLVITQKGREDYLVVPVDVEHERADFAKYGNLARKEFDEALNHKQGSSIVVRALTACKSRCSHTDDFAGFVEPCTNPNCAVGIWKDGASYVNPSED